MAISNFLNSEEEKDIQDGMGELGPEEVLEEHLGQGSTQDDDEEEEQLEQPVFTIQSACQALQVLIGFAEGQDALKAEHLRGLERLESILDALDQESRIQSRLDGWIMQNSV
ncbi:hypothetical protein VC83_07199 [Pseudogymnoascus destructans]|uniref:Uncharacterized protein n=2 Tax=Pseudogymnoascus destructans TaxID=655981 RepID=L8FSI3_PSED2|nr:uncharacterized protein VC83_07199 [Pseudogymnoascus destructans]ELR03438.1 hypothetical protein GMDG_06173 [Pseudogymnoascus destructans 20631-21]OAF56537.1 hypothetical protein VC83_07199 [Pseudogymnoascus destructans]